MKIVKLDKKQGIVKAIIKSYDDLIILSYVIEEGDRLTAYSRRKINVGSAQEIKLVKIGIEVETVRLTDTTLNVSGKIFASSDEDIPLHKYHTIDLRSKNGFVLSKARLLSFQSHMLLKSQERSSKILICVYEEGYAIFYKITNYSLKRLFEIKEAVSGKRFKNESRAKFFNSLVTAILGEYNKTKWSLVIVAGKAMDNEELKKTALKDTNISYETVSYADTGLKELVEKDKINTLVKNTKISLQRTLVKSYISEISNGNKAFIYGPEKIKAALDGAVPEEAIITREFVLRYKELIEELDEKGTNIIFFDEKDESLDMLSGFGGAIIKLH